jgi:AbrB family looped-hinge helix DNA binding protein
MKAKVKSLAQESQDMPLVKVIRNGQITIPKEIRKSFSIEDGDLLEIEPSSSGFLIKPKAVVDRDESAQKFFKQVSQIRKNAEKFKPEEVDEILAEAVEAAKKATAEKRKLKANV